MKLVQSLLLIFLFVGCAYLPANEELMRDLMIVDWVNRQLEYRYPTTYNNTLQGGYINMPSALMGEDGEIGLGFSKVPPYRNWNVRSQIYENLEVTANYRVFCGILDPVFGHMGFGEFSDKGANLKLALIRPEDSDYILPGISIGWDDFLGTKGFESQYIVATQVLPEFNAEISVGYGSGRIKQWFGGLLWYPFGRSWCSPFRNLSLTIEYDAIDYKNPEREPHPDGRSQKSKVNYGFKYRLWNTFDLMASYVRGEEYSFALSTYYNFGKTQGLLPKIDNPLPYIAPKNTQSIGWLRPEEVVVQDFVYALREQGFELLGAYLTMDECCRRVLRLNIYNCRYLFESQVRCRINHILGNLAPSNIDKFVVVLEAEGFPIQEYHYHSCFLKMYANRCIGDSELDLISPEREVQTPAACATQQLFKQERSLFCFTLLPKVHTFFGSTTGKFKYALGLSAGACGYLPYDIFYQFQVGWIGITKLENMIGIDRLNPSQLINVHTDIVCYFQQKGITFDQLYLQKSVNLSHGWFGQLSLGYFAQNYVGAAAEVLYYPVNSCFAVGFEAALLKKRTTTGLGFTNTIRKFDGFVPTYVPFTGLQYFVDLYYDLRDWQTNFKMSIGRFLARDVGIRYECTRYFSNGLELFGWYTRTNGHDMVNGETYFDKGIGISMPLDFFYTYSCRKRWNYSMSAWLRDVGYRGPTGRRLYKTIYNQRFW